MCNNDEWRIKAEKQQAEHWRNWYFKRTDEVNELRDKLDYYRIRFYIFIPISVFITYILTRILF